MNDGIIDHICCEVVGYTWVHIDENLYYKINRRIIHPVIDLMREPIKEPVREQVKKQIYEKIEDDLNND